MIDNLKEFNTLRYQHTIDGTPLPTSVALLSAAQSSMQLHNSSDAPQKAKCGIYLAKRICKQANHITAYCEFPQSNRGNRKNHCLLLNRPDLREALVKWAALQAPGSVSKLLFSFCLSGVPRCSFSLFIG